MKLERKYYKKIDIIRILACVIVLLYHLNIIKSGYLAVCTFFTLSGYLTYKSAFQNKKFSIKEYYLNRLKKLYFPLIIIITITIILTKVIPNINFLNLKQETLSVIFSYNNFWQLNANLDYFTKVLDSPFKHLWYISILFQFDLVFPIIFILLKKIDKKISDNISTIIYYLLLITSTIYFFYIGKNLSIMKVYYNTFARSFSIFFGVFLAILECKYKIKLPKKISNYHNYIFSIYLGILVILCMLPFNKNNYYLYMLITTIISTRLIRYATIKDTKKDKQNKLLKLISDITYEIYLIQYPVIFLVSNILVNDSFQIPIIIGLTLIFSLLIHFIVNLTFKSKVFNFFKYILFISLSGCLVYILINETDYTVEISELENRLKSNLKLIEEKNNQYLNNLNQEQVELQLLLDSVDKEEESIEEIINKMPIVGVGDSVLLMAIDSLYDKFPNGYFDGKVSRSILSGEDVLINLKNQGKLGNTIILSLANNGFFYEKTCRHLMSIIGDREVYWVNAVGADEPSFNEKFAKFALSYPNIHLVKWDIISKNHSEYFYKDGIHPKEEGQKAYANAIYEEIYNNYLEKYQAKKEEIKNNFKNKLKTKITFYGNDALTYLFSYLNYSFNDANFNYITNYSFNSLYDDLKSKIDRNILEYKVVFLFDKESNISLFEYKKLVELCKDYEIYICNLTDKELVFSESNVEVINFYDEINNNKNYLEKDGSYLSEEGNKRLADMLIDKILFNDEDG